MEARSPGRRSNVENAPRYLPVSSARRPRRAFALCRHIVGWTQTCNGFTLCCHSNTTRALIANPPNSAQLGGIPYHYPKLHPGPCNSVGMRPWTDTETQTHTDTQMRVTTIHFSWSTTHAKCNKSIPLAAASSQGVDKTEAGLKELRIR